MYEFDFVKNRDNELCNPFGDNPIDEVNGAGGEEIPEFVPTRNELVQLSKHWIKRRLQTDFFSFIYLTGCSMDETLLTFAQRRIDRITDCLADVIMKNAQKEAEEEFAKTVDAEAWHAFRHGTPDELPAFREKVEQQLAQQAKETRNGMVTVFGVESMYIPTSALRPMEEFPISPRDASKETQNENEKEQ